MKKLLHCIFALLVLLPLAQAEDVTYFIPDAQGSPIAAMNEAGDIIWRKHYTPFGAEIETTNVNRISYTGHVKDQTTGLNYMGARYYDPSIGRFMSMDPAAVNPNDPRTFNRYAYANNNPYRFVDPDGKNALAVELIGLASILYFGSAILPGHEERVNSLLQAWGALNENADNPSQVDDVSNDAESEDQGCIYCVKGDKTKTGKDYIGSTDDLEKRQRDKSDGRDREGAEVVDTYTKGDRSARRAKEQQAMNDRGGVDKLDNKRNEVRPNKWSDMDIKEP